MSTPQPETKAEAEALVPQFKLERVLNQGETCDQVSVTEAAATAPSIGTLFNRLLAFPLCHNPFLT